MHVDTEAWIVKTEGDYIGASTLVKKRSEKVAHLTCFAAQQYAEKYLKAFLVEHHIPFSKTHDLTKDLLPQCVKTDNRFSELFTFLEFLDPYAVEFRYPGEVVTYAEAIQAVKNVKIVRKFVREKLGIGRQRRLL
jgi:HEPN domain-containing protein